MTALNVIVRPQQVYILTDGAGVQPDGVLSGFVVKAHPLAHLNAAMAFRGNTVLTAGLLGVVSSCESFDALVAGVGAKLRAGLGTRMDGVPAAERHLLEFELVVAGWSEARQAMECHYLTNADPYGTGIALWQMHPRPHGMISPAGDELEERFAAAGVNPDRMVDPVEDGLPLMREQRAYKAPLAPGAPPIHHIGGFCQLTTVRRHDVTVRILERWPDRIGRKIEP
jgi:hypothetical protein